MLRGAALLVIVALMASGAMGIQDAAAKGSGGGHGGGGSGLRDHIGGAATGSRAARLPATGEYWYRCDSPHGYYPNVKHCSQNWQRVPTAPPLPPGGDN